MKLLVLSLFTFLLFTLNSEASTRFLKTEVSQIGLDKPVMSEEDKINYLITYVRNLQGMTFIRNGKEFPPQEAADHLQKKYEKHKKKVKTAHDFVDGLASKSSASGEVYLIRLSGGETMQCGDLLNKELKRIES